MMARHIRLHAQSASTIMTMDVIVFGSSAMCATSGPMATASAFGLCGHAAKQPTPVITVRTQQTGPPADHHEERSRGLPEGSSAHPSAGLLAASWVEAVALGWESLGR